jgi:hypothetical protein
MKISEIIEAQPGRERINHVIFGGTAINQHHGRAAERKTARAK